MKTIKEIADNLGVSKQAVRNEIKKQGVQSLLAKDGNVLFVPEDVEILINNEFILRRNKKLISDVRQELPHSNFAAENPLKDELKAKNEQIAALNAQIERLQQENAELIRQNGETVAAFQETIKSLNENLKAAQALHAGTIQERLETKDETIIEPETTQDGTAAAGETAAEQTENRRDLNEQPPKKSFWQRIFGKR